MGYSLDRFGEVDKDIERSRRYDRGSDYAGKTERYGEKYSLIAYREIMGTKLDK